jgi:hypothetical protein
VVGEEAAVCQNNKAKTVPPKRDTARRKFSGPSPEQPKERRPAPATDVGAKEKSKEESENGRVWSNSGNRRHSNQMQSANGKMMEEVQHTQLSSRPGACCNEWGPWNLPWAAWALFAAWAWSPL